MQAPEYHFQRRAIAGDRHFILADPTEPDVWALAGPVVTGTDENGVRSFGPARTISTQALRAWAQAKNLPFRIEDKFPLVRRDINEPIAA